MPDLAIDSLSTTISPQAIKDVGYVGVLNYLRNITADVVAGYHSAGLGFGSIFETLANESLSGAPAGSRDGQTAAAQMQKLGQPTGTLHVVNLADFAATSTELSVIEAYWNAYLAQTSAWHVIPYGTGWLLQAMNQPGWQNAMNDNGVLGSTVVPQAVLYQRVQPTHVIPGASYDEDVILQPLPWWTSQPNPTPQPVPCVIGGQPAMRIPVPLFKTDAAGWFATGIVLPAGKTKDDIVSVVCDAASAYDPQSWHFCSGAPDWQDPGQPSNVARIVFKSVAPNDQFTARVFVTD